MLRCCLTVVALCGTLRNAAAGTPVFVMLPLDTVTNDGALSDPNTLASNLGALKSSGADGVMTDVWWGVAERDAPAEYDFSAWVQLGQLVSDAGLKLEAVLSFHQCGGNVGDDCNIPLPAWALEPARTAGALYKDHEGDASEEYISLFADEIALDSASRSPVEIYAAFAAAFVEAMAPFAANGTLVEVEVGLGPAGELRYPSYPLSRWSFPGVGEFQCFDDGALASLANASAAAGHADWGTPPSGVGDYNSRPEDTTFFVDGYQSAAGQFFLGWYAGALIDHGDRVLGAVRNAMAPSQHQWRGSSSSSNDGGDDAMLRLSAKVSGVHWWFNTDHHAAELTAGYWNAGARDGYEAIAQMLASHNADLDFTCLEMKDSEQSGGNCQCGPEELVAQTRAAAHGAGTGYSGENALPRYDQTAYDQVIAQSSAGVSLDAFTYLRLTPDLLNSDNLGTFAGFVSKMHSL